MDISLIIFIAIVIIAAFRGYKTGLIAIIIRIVSLLGAYVAALLFAKPFGQWLQNTTDIQGLWTYPLAGMILFVGTSLLLSMIFSFSSKLMVKEKQLVSTASSLSGALLGGLVGVLIAIFAVWFFSTIKEVINTKKGQPIIPPTQIEQTSKELAAKVVTVVVEKVSEQPELAAASGALLANPAENMARIQRINQSGGFKKLFKNESMQVVLDSGNSQAVKSRPEFQRLVNNSDFIALSKAFGFSENSGEMQQQVADKMTTVWMQIKTIQFDPEFNSRLKDPEIQTMLKSGDIYSMMTSKKVEELLNIISSVKLPDGILTNTKVENKSVNRWVDEKGRVHYSDKENSADNE